MKDKTDRPRRKNIRLKEYDYSLPGMYFVTISTYNNMELFGEIKGTGIELSQFGEIASEEWIRGQTIREEIELDEYVVMPDHFHALVAIIDVRATGRSPAKINPVNRDKQPGPRRKSLGSLIAGFKSSVTTRINILRGTPGECVWHRGYYEHIIRNPYDLEDLRAYIRNNPWKLWDIQQGFQR